MAIPPIRVSSTPDGDVKAELDLARRVVIDRRSGNLISATVREGSDEFRWLISAARIWRAF